MCPGMHERHPLKNSCRNLPRETSMFHPAAEIHADGFFSRADDSRPPGRSMGGMCESFDHPFFRSYGLLVLMAFQSFREAGAYP